MLKLMCLILGVLLRAEAFSGGAPDKTCQSMLPVHANNKPQAGASPYTLSVLPILDKGQPTQYWNISISSEKGSNFKGLLLQARPDPTTLPTIGRFNSVPENLQIKECSEKKNFYVTHLDNSNKITTFIEWESPAEYDGNVTFVATLVESYDKIWAGLKSDSIKITKRNADASTVDEPIESQLEKDSYDGCGEYKKCIGSSTDCIKNRNCIAFTSIMAQRGNYLFQMFAKDSKYVAVGLSEDDIMGGDGDSVVECVISNSTQEPIKAYRSYNLPNLKQNRRLDENDQKQLFLKKSKYENGILYCELSHEPLVEIENRIFDLDRKEYFILLASGSTLKENGVGYHNKIFTKSLKKARLDDLTPAIVHNDFYNDCNTLKNCFGSPEGCLSGQNCLVAVSISVQGTNYDFELLGNSPGYVAVGLSEDGKMGGDSVVECVNGEAEDNSKNVKLYMSWNIMNKKANTREGVTQDGVKLLNSSYSDGKLYCKFTRNEKTMVSGHLFDLKTNSYYILLAAGSKVRGNGVGYHDILFTASSQKRLLSDVRAFSEASKLLLRLHGAFMITAWIGCASIGILFARYFKQTWVGKSACGKDLWFTWHRFFMLLAWCLTITAFIIIFVEIGEWVEGGSQLHAILGCVTTIFAFIQPIGAAFRPAPNAHNRPIFNWFHWFFGNTAYVFAIATIFFAVPLSKAELPSWFNWMLVPHVILYVLSHFLLSINQCCSQKYSSKVESMAMKDLNSGGGNQHMVDRKVDAPHAGFRKTLLAIYIIFTTLLVAAIVVVVIMAPIEDKLRTL